MSKSPPCHRPVIGLVLGKEPWTERLLQAVESSKLPVAFEIDVDDLGRDIAEHEVDVVVLGTRIGSANEPWLKRLRESLPGTRFLAFARQDEAPSLRWAIEHGVDGVIRHDRLDGAFEIAVSAVRAGLLVVSRDLSRDEDIPDLTNREKQTLGLVIMGLTNREIAEKLYISESTVKSHLYSAYQKLGVHSRAEAVRVIADPVEGLGTGILAITTSGLARGRS